ncbi:dihydroxyacetone kinase subunit L [Shinella yambaruensis]|uniref:Dihydroxyacetone kinase subunit L n=1 Tax=Shinella yambaruensis TaxID=415996 RepID=A0ABQ5ZQV9_9HYPH|nr:dihydroxyacetone kinase subunit DhaL [Shinella yambaruensis]MCJ8025179.1 dihydroxyacetone kinase subunit L [Shinella yambaruensis]MCU7980616.1 dihydroxyacetone kinase subunit L [Shinella yambaruensis]GLR54136.1 dihydroxyacetone kinase subunit L [Shinella yambaruensis]
MSESAARALAKMFERMAEAIEAEKDHLSELDGAIGDGDHGITMSIGFKAVSAALSALDLDAASPSEVMSTAATGFLDAVGASTGPLYATGFRRAAQTLAGRENLDLPACRDMLAALSEGIRERGKAQRGDKTMLDVWLPAAQAAATAVAEGRSKPDFWAAVTSAADNGAAATATMVAAKGRAARVRERSLGHLDPGATSAAALVRAMAEAL